MLAWIILIAVIAVFIIAGFASIPSPHLDIDDED